MKVLRVLMITVIALFVIYCLAMFALPGTFNISRSETVKTSPTNAFQYISEFKNWPEWMPWFKDDTTIQVSFGDTTRGLGAHYSWVSQNSGSVSQTITAVDKPDSFTTKIHFQGTFESHSNGYWHFESNEVDSTKITWGLQGKLPFLLRSMGFVLENRIGKAFERGLTNIRARLDENNRELMSIEEVMVKGAQYYGLTQKSRISEMKSGGFGESYLHIARYLGKDMQHFNSAPRAIFHRWDEHADSAFIELALPLNSEKYGNDTIKRDTSYEGLALKMVFKGPYANTSEAHNSIGNYMEQNNYQEVASPWEVYVSDPSVEKNPENYITEIYYPVDTL